MKITPKNSVKKFQMGGPVLGAPVDELPVAEETVLEQLAVPLQGLEQDPIMILAWMSALALLNLDCLMAMQVCQAFIQLIQLAQGSAPQEPLGEPVFKKGGILVRRIKK